MAVILTTAYHRINLLTKKYRVIQGGQGGSKTYSILIKFLLIAQKEAGSRITVVAQDYPTLKDGAIEDFKNICTSAGLNWSSMYNKTDKNVHFQNGSKIEFRNVDSTNWQKYKGVRRDYLFVNEANKVPYMTLEQMLTRSKVVYIDFNPDEEFWVHERIVIREDADFIVLTYKDNEMLSKEEKLEIESRIAASLLEGATDELKNWVKIYAYGEIGVYNERRIYSYNFFDQLPNKAKRIPSGMDFGISPDPTILIDVWLDGINIYIDEIFCENNLLPAKIKGAERDAVVDRMKSIKFKKGQMIIADSAGKTTIDDLKKYGYNVLGVKKRKGFQMEGIRKLRGYNIFITERSKNVKKGIEKFFFKIDHNGKIIPEADGHEPDGLAALRYIFWMKGRRW